MPSNSADTFDPPEEENALIWRSVFSTKERGGFKGT
jgi:hypothetical protein